VVGGVRSLAQAVRCLRDQGLDAVGLCRPLIREPDLPNLWLRGQSAESTCTNCNLCTVYCDSGEITKCREVAVPIVEGRST
jgi:2,4-dienoyl-CoA reductase-like NADH-dependent reductase (Old Yellow Enzyme family)